MKRGDLMMRATHGIKLAFVCIARLMAVALIFAVFPSHASLLNKALVYCSEGTPAGFDPAQFTTSVEYTVSAFTIHNRLVEFKRGSTKIGPGLAAHWNISPDGLQYTFYLRRDVKFHTTSYFRPTREFNADDVLFTFERMRNPNHPFRKAYPAPVPYFMNLGLDKEITKIEKLDLYTVRFTLKSANAPFLTNLGLAFASILSAEYADQLLKAGKASNINWWPVGTGPFVFRSYTKETEAEDALIRFDSNSEYWRPQDVQVSSLIFKIVPDAAERVRKLKRNECQIMNYPRPADFAAIEADPKLELLSQPGLNLSYLAYNVLHPPLDNVLVRRALDMAINKKAIIKATFRGREGAAQVASAPIPPALWSHDETLKDELFDLEKAKALLAEAGYPKGFTISLWTLPVQRPYNPNPRLTAEIIQADWAKIGVRAKILTHSWGKYIKDGHDGEHDAMLIGWTGNSDPDDWFGVTLTCDAMSGLNYSKWCYPPFDALIKGARQTNDMEKRAAFYQEAQRIFNRELPFTPILHATVYQPINKNVTGFKINPLSATVFTGVSLK